MRAVGGNLGKIDNVWILRRRIFWADRLKNLVERYGHRMLTYSALQHQRRGLLLRTQSSKVTDLTFVFFLISHQYDFAEFPGVVVDELVTLRTHSHQIANVVYIDWTFFKPSRSGFA